ncbi:MAG: hypothetical protein A3F84_18235 [Candidatus Handelsmanbacteria bacterium RIFCSPLOWO2_12_FULL_64_10]|uniref:Uncharacterized protein n=1 Tax=Handelsmanbacteria sp. (strain RIFCSPLOWO2_12_FULL_64_10) TaxID=1817868 RepID=A0A1F6CC60_HANXR|nr:MAG: hypothetical protein A3F84_18235 [Candidatus Handelsmanbacteria bacterium RIFCSPLOWO2_12_FULL_64_10]
MSALSEITQLKDLCLETILASDGQARCKIVVPDGEGWAGLGAQVQGRIREVSGATAEVVRAATVSEGDWRGFHLIVLGSMLNNAAIFRLYTNHYAFTDDAYPGEGGWEVRTIHNPFGHGRNVCCWGGVTWRGWRRRQES